MPKVPMLFALLGLALMGFGIYIYVYGLSQSTSFINSQDVWDPADPKGVFFFNFSSPGAIAANKPVHIKVTFYFSEGVNITDMMPLGIVFPDAFAYPLQASPQNTTYSAASVNLTSETGPLVGETDAVFQQSGKFGYIVFSKEKPVWLDIFEPSFVAIVEIQPAYVGQLAEIADRVLSISSMDFGICIEIFVFRRHLELVAGKKRPAKKARIVIYAIIGVAVSTLVYSVSALVFGKSGIEIFLASVVAGSAIFGALATMR
jgi:hypothetical protein